MNGMSVAWEIGERKPVGNTVTVGKGENARQVFEPRLGKNKGPVFSQTVVKILRPRSAG
jgi:hypothetical protein